MRDAEGLALPFNTFEKSGKRIAEALAKPKAARPEQSEGHPQIPQIILMKKLVDTFSTFIFAQKY